MKLISVIIKEEKNMDKVLFIIQVVEKDYIKDNLLMIKNKEQGQPFQIMAILLMDNGKMTR